VYYDVFHLPPDKAFHDSCLDLESLDLQELPNLENVVIHGTFKCAHNHLRNLKGAPRTIRGCFSFYDNPIESLEGFPEYAGSVSSPVALDEARQKCVPGDITIITNGVSNLVKSQVILPPYLVDRR